jgi:hypothetical protein
LGCLGEGCGPRVGSDVLRVQSVPRSC